MCLIPFYFSTYIFFFGQIVCLIGSLTRLIELLVSVIISKSIILSKVQN